MPNTPVQIPWPKSALPGRRPGDSQGDLINAYAIQVGEMIQIRRTPGLQVMYTLAEQDFRTARGMHALNDRLLHAWDDELYITVGSTTTAVIGGLAGDDPVTMAHNMREPLPDVVVVTQLGSYVVDMATGVISPYPDPLGNLGPVSTVEYFSGYFVFTKPNGYFVVSDLQNTDIPDLSFGKTEYVADTLLRAKAVGPSLFLMSTRSIEVWVDVATAPMPFQRQTALDVGLLGKWAVAGGSNEWERGLFFVASDYTVRQMKGLNPEIISNDDVALDIYRCRHNVDAIKAQVYTFEQQAVFSITCPEEGWTWEYNASSGAWHRRDSYSKPYWRGGFATQYFNQWICQDILWGRLLEIQKEVFDEAGERLRIRVESAPIKAFPASIRVPSIDIDAVVAQGKTGVPSPYETQPVMMISWSHDGGANWSRPVARSMGAIGRYANKLTVNNLGRSTHHGVMIRCEVVDPVQVMIMGGVSTSTKASRARGVDK